MTTLLTITNHQLMMRNTCVKMVVTALVFPRLSKKGARVSISQDKQISHLGATKRMAWFKAVAPSLELDAKDRGVRTGIDRRDLLVHQRLLA